MRLAAKNIIAWAVFGAALLAWPAMGPVTALANEPSAEMAAPQKKAQEPRPGEEPAGASPATVRDGTTFTIADGEDLERPLDGSDLNALSGRHKVPLKLKDAVSLGLTRNIDIKKDIMDRASQRLSLSLAERYFEPRFYIQGGYDYDRGTNTDTRSLGLKVEKSLSTAGELTFNWAPSNLHYRDTNETQFENQVSISLTQPLLRGAGITVGTAEVVGAQYTEESNVQQFRQSLMDKITTVQEAYWDLLLALEDRLSAVRSLEASREVLARNKVLIEVGRKAKSDLVSAQQEVASNQVSVLDREFEVVQANRTLVNLLDMDDTVAILPVEGFVYRPVKVDYEKLLRSALARNTSLVQYRVSLKQRKLELELARSQAKDKVDLQMSLAKTGKGGNFGESLDGTTTDIGDGFQAGLSIEIPLGLPRDNLKYNVTVAARSLAKAELDIKQQTLAVKQQVRDGVNDVRRSLRQIKLAQLSRQLAQKKYEIERFRLELGRTTNFQVLSYQRDLTDARDQEHQAIATYLKSLARLDSIVGNTLETWNVKVVNMEPAKLPRLNLKGLTQPEIFKSDADPAKK